MPKVLILFGSESDAGVMSKASVLLKKFGVAYDAFAISAHRMPDVLEEKLKEAEKEGVDVIVAGAGLAAHLPGVVASKTIIPVIGVPLNGALDGLDALLSIVQMPKDIPVATVAIDNAHNAAILAIQIMSLKYPELKQKLIDFRKQRKEELLPNIKQNI